MKSNYKHGCTHGKHAHKERIPPHMDTCNRHTGLPVLMTSNHKHGCAILAILTRPKHIKEENGFKTHK